MIGRFDIIIPVGGADPATVMEAGARLILQRWPRAIFQNGSDTDSTLYPSFDVVPFGHLSELFVYEDPVAYRDCDELGSTPETEDRFIHLIHWEEALTLVVGHLDKAPIPELVETIRQRFAEGALPHDFHRAA